MQNNKLRIAILGTRGVPANYGGFETCVEEVGRRLVKKGHYVVVYCRKWYYEKDFDEYLGMKRRCLPNVESKYLDTMSNTFLSAWHALFEDFDIYMVFNAANSPFIIPLRVFRKTISINTDGLEWKRSKWGFWGKFFHRISEKISCLVANQIVTDCKGMKNYYLDEHKIDSTMIAYGATIQSSKNPELLKRLGLKPKEFFLQITRFEPENHPFLTIEAFKKLSSNKKLVLVGGNTYPNSYTRLIEAESNNQVLLAGFIYDQDMLRELWCNCFAYIHGNSVGGTNPALLQAMGSGCFIISIENDFNRNVLSNCGIYYKNDKKDLAEKMQWTFENEEKLQDFKEKARIRIFENYLWGKIADQYEQLFYDLHDRKYPRCFNWKVLVKGR
jgi:glycosyltransferase involved in cell wall biosynthesis